MLDALMEFLRGLRIREGTAGVAEHHDDIRLEGHSFGRFEVFLVGDTAKGLARTAFGKAFRHAVHKAPDMPGEVAGALAVWMRQVRLALRTRADFEEAVVGPHREDLQVGMFREIFHDEVQEGIHHRLVVET